jgi:hypothetical protein
MGLEEFTSPEHAYTDRQVREDPDLRTWAEGYVRIYGGSFEPLVNAKAELYRMDRLAVRTTRIVLNCARYDPNFADQLPEPKPPTLELVKDMAKVAPFCSDPRPHYRHSDYIPQKGRRDKLVQCPGVPWEINRYEFDTAVNIKAEYVSARSSSIYHRCTGVGEQVWHPPTHSAGPAVRGDLVIETVCKYPGRLRNAYLFFDEPTELWSGLKKYTPFRTRCPNGCFSQ